MRPVTRCRRDSDRERRQASSPGSRVTTTGGRRQRRQRAPSRRRPRAFGPRHHRQAPPIGRQRAARRLSRSLSGPLRGFQPCGGTPGYPRNSEKCPLTPFPQAPLAPCGPPHGVRLDPQSKAPTCGQRVAVPRRLPLAGRRATGPPVQVAQAAADEYRRADDLGHSAPPPPSGTAVWRAAGRSLSQSAAQRPSAGLPTPRHCDCSSAAPCTTNRPTSPWVPLRHRFSS